MTNIKPTYVTFEQAKWLKEINCDIRCNQAYDFRGGDIKYLGRYIDSHLLYTAPEQWQVVEWLRVNHGIWINISPTFEFFEK